MNINIILTFIASILAFIFFYFKPIHVQHSAAPKDLAQVEIHNFTLYQFDTQKLVDETLGKVGKIFPHRYEMYQFDFLDNSNGSLVHLSAQKGTYKKDILYVNDDIEYSTEDGLNFQTQELQYLRKKGIVRNKSKFFVQYQDKHKMYGEKLYYNIDSKRFHSQNTTIIYFLGNDQ